MTSKQALTQSKTVTATDRCTAFPLLLPAHVLLRFLFFFNYLRTSLIEFYGLEVEKTSALLKNTVKVKIKNC